MGLVRCRPNLLEPETYSQTMKLYVTLCLVSLTSAIPQFGFLNNIFNGFRGNRGGGRRPASGGGGGGCGGGHRPNHQFGGQNFLVSWRLGCTSFTQSQGEAFCRNNGMRAISIDSASKEREFTGLVAREGQRFYWTGGRVSGGRISWPSGRAHNNVAWSHTGGAGRAQPDNRSGYYNNITQANYLGQSEIRSHFS